MNSDLYKRSIQVIRENQDTSGAYIASPSFPTYHYCWLRDGSFIAHAMDAAGEYKSSEAFFRWAGSVIQKFAYKVDHIEKNIQAGTPIGKDDFLHTRYTLDGNEVTVDNTWGNFQIDGYGTWLWALTEHVRLSGDTVLLKDLSAAIETCLRYLKLVWQMPNYDCWEEHPEYLHPYSLATVYAGFNSISQLQSNGAASFIHLPACEYAQQVKAFIQDYAVVDGRFVKHVWPERSPERPKPVVNSSVDSSLLGLAVPYNVISVDDPVFQATLETIEKKLHREEGGVYRYRADVYYGGGEWLLLSAWLGWCYARSGRLEPARELMTWINSKADLEGNLPEQVNDHPLAPKHYQPWVTKWGAVASPLLWSHAMYIILHHEIQEREIKLMSSDIKSSFILHKPCGDEHPFDQLPYERFPRNPVAGEPVTLGVTTNPGSTIESVWCTWQVEESWQEFQAQGTLSAENGTSKIWQIPLPDFPGGSRVNYRVFGKGNECQLQTESFSFAVATWVPILSATSFKGNADGLSAFLATARDDFCVQLKIEQGVAGTLSFLFSAAEAEHAVLSRTPSTMAELADLEIEFLSEPFGLRITRKSDGMLLQTSGPLSVLISADGQILRYRVSFVSPNDEGFYGFGERFNALNQRGSQLENRLIEQYKSQGTRTYVPVPFFISSRGYGLWIKTDRWVEFDLASREENTWRLDGEADRNSQLQLVLLPQSQPHALMEAFTNLTGKPKLPPTWVFGLWMSGNGWNSQKEVLRQLDLAHQHNIPATVLVIEAWSDEINFYIWNDAQYQIKSPAEAYSLSDFTFPAGGHWPDPKAMIDTLHQNGIRLVLWQIPVIKQPKPAENLDATQNQADMAYALENGFCVKNSSGTPYRVVPPWFHGGTLIDFSNPKAYTWWFSKRKYLLTDLHVDGFKTDGGEHLWARDTSFYDGQTGNERINSYSLLYIGAYDRFLREHRGSDSTLFSRSGYTGLQQFPCQWAGDENSTWPAYRASILAMLNAGLCGVPFIGWDIAGFSGEAPGAELYLRATAMSVFCPIMQFHSEDNALRKPSRDRSPWYIQDLTGDMDVIPLFRKFTNLRMNLMPYLLSQAWLASQSGIPMMRPLALEYPQDVQCRNFPLQYCFGDALLVAPVTEEGAGTWPVYLPEGEWRELWTGDVHHGPTAIEVDAPRDRIPVFQKKGSILALNLDKSGQLGSPVGNRTEKFAHLTLQIFPAGKIESPIFQSSETAQAWVTVQTTEREGTIEVQLPALMQDVDLVIFGHEPASVTSDGEAIPRLDAGVLPGSVPGWQWNSQKHELRIHLPEHLEAAKIIIQ